MLAELWSSHDDESLQAFLAAARRGDLVDALIRMEGGGRGEVAEANARLEGWGARVAPRLLKEDPSWSAEALTLVLSGELGIRGDEDTYYDVKNSRLGDVLERRRGLPILLSVVYIEVGRRAGVRVAGVGLPGHFIVRVGPAPGVLLDPFRGGRRLSIAGCRKIVEELSGGRTEWRDEFLDECPPQSILERILQNLYHAYGRISDAAGQYRAATFLSAFRPGSVERLLQRGQAAEALGAGEFARSIYEDLIERFPEAPEAEQAAQALERTEEHGPAN